MLSRTHLIITLFFGLLIIDYVSHPILFLLTALFSTLIPDIDSHNSKLGKKRISKIMTAFSKHRGIFHSLIFMFVIYFVLLKYFPVISFAFVFGYSLHLLTDMTTKRGIQLFYPFAFRIRGFIRSGGRTESFLFIILGLGSLFLLLRRILIINFIFGQ